MSHIVIGTAGHIDHGKTALVKALTGIDTDRLEEEKKRGMTIDLGFAFLNENISIIDVPGHEKFIRNMVAGVSTIHSALIVIAADDGIMPQTLEHIQILDLLGVKNGVVALSKVDASSDSEWLDLVEEEIRENLENTGLKNCPVVRTSVITGQGIEELKQILINQADSIRISQNRGFFRMPVDRVFSKSGFGTVLTGTVISGTAGVGDQLMIYPGNKPAKIRGIQSHGNTVEQVSAGDRAAVNLSNLDQKDVFRGSELTISGAIRISRNWIVNVKLLEGSKWQLKNRQKVHLHVGTAETLAIVSGLKSTLNPGESSNLILSLFDQIPANQEDRFIIRSYSPVNTIGGGKVLEISEDRLTSFIRRRVNKIPIDLSERFKWLIFETSQTPRNIKDWALLLGQSEDMINNEIRVHQFDKTISSELIFSPREFEKHKNELVKIVSNLHKENTFRSSINIEQVRLNSGLSNLWFEYCLDSLLKEQKLERSKSGLSLPGFEVSVSKKDMENIEKLKDQIENNTFETLAKKDLLERLKIPEDNLNSYLHYLKDNNQILNITGDDWVSIKALDTLLIKLQEHFSRSDYLEVADFKKITGLSRKTAIPWLEYLDKYNFTARDGNTRSKGEDL